MNNGPEEIKSTPARGDEVSATLLDAELERELRYALQPVDPPAGFLDRALARAGVAAAYPPAPIAAAPSKVLRWPTRRLWVGGAVAAALLLGSFEGEIAWQKFREQQRRVAQATAQFEVTERVTVRALAQAREQLQRAGVPLTLD